MQKKQLTDTKIMKVLAKHTDILQKYRVKRIGLFGSYVRGTQTDKSDIDFLVEFKQPSFDDFMDLMFSLENLFSKKIELITSDSLSPYIKPYVEKEVEWYEAG